MTKGDLGIFLINENIIIKKENLKGTGPIDHIGNRNISKNIKAKRLFSVLNIFNILFFCVFK